MRLTDTTRSVLVLRLAAVGVGVLFVLVDPSAGLAGALPHRSPSGPLLLLGLLAASTVLGPLLLARARHRARAEAAWLAADLLLVGGLTRLTAGADSVFYLYFPVVLAWSPVGTGPLRGALAGLAAAAVFSLLAGAESGLRAVVQTGVLLPLLGGVLGSARLLHRRSLLSRLEAARAARAQWQRLDRVASTVRQMAALPLETRVDRFLAELLEVGRADVGLVALLDEDGVPTVAGVRNLELREWRGRRVLPDSGVVARVLEAGEVAVTERMDLDPEWTESFAGLEVAAALALPLQIEGRPLGFALAGRYNGRRFSRDDVEALRVLAAQATVAIHDARVQEQLRDLLYSAVNTLTAALEAKDPYTRGHSQRVATSAAAIAAEMGLPPEQVEQIRLASLLHDIGKIATPEHILRKRGSLSAEERLIVNQHAERGAAILREMRPFRPLVDLVLHHQESYDGTGYPDGLAGEAIPLGARIIRVADTFDALVSDRPYRRGKSLTEAVEEVRRMAGTTLDPAVVETFLRVLATKPPFDIQLRMWREGS